MKRSIGAFVVALAMGSVAAAAPWSLTTADFQTRQVELQGMTADAVTFKAAGGTESVPVGNLLALSHEASGGTAKPGAFNLVLASGDRLTGKPVGIAGEVLTWESPAVGKMTVPLRQVQAMAKGSAAVPSPEQAVAEDTLTLGNGDVVKGIVTGLADGKIQATVAGENVAVPVDSVATLVFASPGKAVAKAERGFRVKLADGSTLTGSAVMINGEQVNVKLSDNTARELPAASVTAVEQVNGPVTFLSSLTPAEDVQKPYLGDVWPTRVDRTVTGQPLPTIGGKKFERGIGVHAYSRLTYALDGSFKEFRTQYAIDGGGAYANVVVRVTVDGKAVYERKNVTASANVSDVVRVPVAGAKALVLEVDYGLSNDTQDRFVWLEPALLRQTAEAK